MTDKKIKDFTKGIEKSRNFIQQTKKKFFKWLPIKTAPLLLDTLKRKSRTMKQQKKCLKNSLNNGRHEHENTFKAMYLKSAMRS